jgi:hypothetical protein
VVSDHGSEGSFNNPFAGPTTPGQVPEPIDPPDDPEPLPSPASPPEIVEWITSPEGSFNNPNVGPPTPENIENVTRSREQENNEKLAQAHHDLFQQRAQAEEAFRKFLRTSPLPIPFTEENIDEANAVLKLFSDEALEYMRKILGETEGLSKHILDGYLRDPSTIPRDARVLHAVRGVEFDELLNCSGCLEDLISGVSIESARFFGDLVARGLGPSNDPWRLGPISDPNTANPEIRIANLAQVIRLASKLAEVEAYIRNSDSGYFPPPREYVTGPATSASSGEPEGEFNNPYVGPTVPGVPPIPTEPYILGVPLQTIKETGGSRTVHSNGGGGGGIKNNCVHDYIQGFQAKPGESDAEAVVRMRTVIQDGLKTGRFKDCGQKRPRR